MFAVTAFNIIEFYVCLRRLSFYNFCSNGLIERNLKPILQEKPLHTINLNLHLLALEKKCYCHMKGNACSHLIGICTNHLIKWRGHSMYGLNKTCFQCRDIVKSDLNLFHILYLINTLKDWMAILPKNCTRKNFTHTL